MKPLDFDSFIAALPSPARLLGLDVGEKTIGVAVGDTGLKIATSVMTIQRSNFSRDMAALNALYRERRAVGVIVGLPINMDGSMGPRVQSVRDWTLEMLHQGKAIGFEPLVCFQDERLSTAAVTRAMIQEGDLSRKKRDKAVDAAAATWILQGFLDRLR